MDLYTASRRLSDSFAIDGRPIPISHHGLIGDGFSCALVGVDGSVSWLCMPRFDSPSVFASILDPEAGGRCQVAPVAERYETLQAYDTATAVLQTLFRNPGEGAVVLTDFMPMTDEGHSSVHELHRLLEVREGSLEMEVVFDVPQESLAHRAEFEELLKDERQGVSDAPIGIFGHLAIGRFHVPDRNVHNELTTLGFCMTRFERSKTQDIEFIFVKASLQS